MWDFSFYRKPFELNCAKCKQDIASALQAFETPAPAPPIFTERAARAVPSRFGQRAARGLTAHALLSDASSCEVRAGSSIGRCGGESARDTGTTINTAHWGKGLTSHLFYWASLNKEKAAHGTHTQCIYVFTQHMK